jgi:predicted dehydrogenase
LPGAESALPVRVGVIGQGCWGTRLAAALRASSRFRLEALCDLQAERLSTGGPEHLTQCVEELLGLGLEAVVIATNPAAHVELAAASLESGHHVLVEKPCALSSEGAECIVRAAERAGRVVGVGHLLRYHASYEALIELVLAGALGAVRGAFAERVGSRPRQDVDAWWMLAPHDLSVLFAMFGEASGDVRRFRTGEDEFVATVQFDGVHAALVARSGGVASRRFAVVGTRMTALLDELETPQRIRLAPTHSPELRPLLVLAEDALSGRRPSAQAIAVALAVASGATEEVFLIEPTLSPLARELGAFADAIRFDRPLMTDIREGLAVVRMLDVPARDRRSSGVGLMEAQLALDP